MFLDKCLEAKCREISLEKSGLEPYGFAQPIGSTALEVDSSASTDGIRLSC